MKDDAISRRAVLKLLSTMPPEDATTKALLIQGVKQMDAAQQEIIRCRDCKHYTFADNRAFGFPVKRCEWTGFEDVDDDDFCSRAERREVSE